MAATFCFVIGSFAYRLYGSLVYWFSCSLLKVGCLGSSGYVPLLKVCEFHLCHWYHLSAASWLVADLYILRVQAIFSYLRLWSVGANRYLLIICVRSLMMDLF
ncbi:uncharacterized protein LOC133909977 [Phragmites australis]|uniref:uncharacterized protein LOC133909977 n=1 Tax=Phragmites australis TaxID=29695 RepID=UPI002D77BDFB|nr:uncharacterized protein LOC133909977 [Phragmites australis]